MAKKTNFGPYFGPFGLNLDQKFNLWILPPLDSRNVVASYHCMPFQGKLMK